MANEIQFPYVIAGLTTLTAKMFKSGNAEAGASPISGITLSDSTSAGVYWGSVPTSPAPTAGQYTVVVYDGASVARDANVISTLEVNRSFTWSVVNTGSGIVTIVGNNGMTYVGNPSIPADTSASFRTIKNAASTFTTYRI